MASEPFVKRCNNCAFSDEHMHGRNCGPCNRHSDWQPAANIPASDRMVTRQDNGGPDIDGGDKVVSDGGSSTYYFLPNGATELNDLIEFKEMSFARGNIFKALYRLGEKAGIDVEYDLNKIQLFLDRLRAMNKSGRSL